VLNITVQQELLDRQTLTHNSTWTAE